MQSIKRIKTLWSLVKPTSAESRVRRRRLAACAALTLLLSGLLTAIGLAIIVIALAAAVLAALCGAAGAHALQACWPRVRLRGGAMLQGSARVLLQARKCVVHIRGLGSSTGTRLRMRGAGLARTGAEHAAHRRRQLATSAQATLTQVRERTAARKLEDLHHEALCLNEAGTRQRRNGSPTEAIDLHRRALDILQGLDDRRAVALTQNNLALALSHVGDDRSAIALFEEAAATLRELGEDEHEGRIIANLGLAHRRHGRHEQSENVLQLALTKLTPDSRAYATVEAELRRAS